MAILNLSEGDFVRIISRNTTSADARNKTYYPFFAGLIGIIDRIYDNGSEACIRVACETLPEDIRLRHRSIQESIKDKWLDGLSREARNRLSAEDKKFELAYTIVVQISDLEKVSPEDAEALTLGDVVDKSLSMEVALPPESNENK